MPPGVEHEVNNTGVWHSVRLRAAPMPQGVEHLEFIDGDRTNCRLRAAPMPPGVEHMNCDSSGVNRGFPHGWLGVALASGVCRNPT